MMRMIRILAILGVFAVGAASAGCSTRGVVTSVGPRLFREVHALRVRSYTLVPVTRDLREYHAAEFRYLNNLALDQMPERSVQQLNSGIAERIRTLGRFERVAVTKGQAEDGASSGSSLPNGTEPGPTLIIEGYIDDYTPGIPKLRLIEKGDNHAVLTVRILLKDKRTSVVLGEKNITVENARVTSNIDRMVDKEASEVAKYVRRSTAREDRSKEALARDYE